MSVRFLVAGVTSAAVALAVVGGAAYRNYYKAPAPPPVPIVAVKTIAIPPPAPAPIAATAPVKHQVAAKAKTKKATKRAKVKVTSQKVPDVAAVLKADSDGSKPLSCATVKHYVATYPGWLLKRFEALATAEQIARGKKCMES